MLLRPIKNSASERSRKIDNPTYQVFCPTPSELGDLEVGKKNFFSQNLSRLSETALTVNVTLPIDAKRFPFRVAGHQAPPTAVTNPILLFGFPYTVHVLVDRGVWCDPVFCEFACQNYHLTQRCRLLHPVLISDRGRLSVSSMRPHGT